MGADVPTGSTRIAQSDRWTALSRVSSVVGTLILVPIAGFVAFTTWQSSNALSAHTEDLANIKASVASIDTRGQADHDKITTVSAAVDALKDKVAWLGTWLGKVADRVYGEQLSAPPKIEQP